MKSKIKWRTWSINSIIDPKLRVRPIYVFKPKHASKTVTEPSPKKQGICNSKRNKPNKQNEPWEVWRPKPQLIFQVGTDPKINTAVKIDNRWGEKINKYRTWRVWIQESQVDPMQQVSWKRSTKQFHRTQLSRIARSQRRQCMYYIKELQDFICF